MNRLYFLHPISGVCSWGYDNQKAKITGITTDGFGDTKTGFSTAIDVDGTDDTVYDVRIEITEKEDGSIEKIDFGVSNDDNEFGCIRTTEVGGSCDHPYIFWN